MGYAFRHILSLCPVLRFVAVLAACISSLACRAEATSSCGFPALFGFGDSLSDTGNAVLINPVFKSAIVSPYGQTYFGRPAGRFSDGRLIIDFLAQSIGLPFLKPYFAYKTSGTDFSQGINYSEDGATVEGLGYLLSHGEITAFSLNSLDTQIGWHLAIQQAAQSPEIAASSYPGVTLPTPTTFAEALYFFELGGNDYTTYVFNRKFLRPGQNPMDYSYVLSNVVPVVVQKLANAVEKLYLNGARNFFILDLGPLGCASFYLRYVNGTKDAKGCIAAVNEIITATNQQFSAAADGLRSKYPDINLLVSDSYNAIGKVLANPSQYGFPGALNACCGAGPTAPYQYGALKSCGGTSYVCPNPSSFVFWDGIHYTDALNRYLVNSIVSGQYLMPSNGLACASSV